VPRRIFGPKRKETQEINIIFAVLGCVMVSVLDIGLKVRKFKLGRGRPLKIRSTPSFGVEIKPSSPCHKILRHVKNPCGV
jgi:hypothetical protein